MTNKNKINIALLGCGKLGHGLYQLFELKRTDILKETGFELEIKHILIKHLHFKREKFIPKEIITNNIDTILKDTSIRLVIDAMGGIEPNYGIIKKFLNKGCHIISANRTLLASKMHDLFELARLRNVHLKYDASLMGGISTIRTVKRDLIGTKITSLWGIISGSVNYILTEMTRTKKSLKEVLKSPSLNGLTESQISVDYEGSETAQKLALITAITYGVEVNYLHIYADGISHITPFDIECADMFGFEFKLIAILKDNGNNLELHIHPTLIPKEHPLTQVKNGYNAYFIETDTMGEIMFYSKGLGIYPIASTIIRDLVDIVDEIKTASFNLYEFPHWIDKSILPIHEIQSGYYLRFRCLDQPGVIGKITTILGNCNINISSAHASLTKNYKNKKTGFIHIFIKQAYEKDILSSLKKIKEFDVIIGKPVYYRILTRYNN
jgi:homoserine dehydrogenase